MNATIVHSGYYYYVVIDGKARAKFLIERHALMALHRIAPTADEDCPLPAAVDNDRIQRADETW